VSAGPDSFNARASELVVQLLEAPNAAARSALYTTQPLGLWLIEALHAEVDRVRDSDTNRAHAAGEVALEAAAVIGDPAARALACQALGYALTFAGELERAFGLLEEARTLYLQLGRELEAARVVMRQLPALALTGRTEEALNRANQAAVVLEHAGLKREYGRLQNNIGNINQRLGRLEEAEAAFERARRTLAEVRDPQGLAEAHVSTGQTYGLQDRFTEAIEHLKTGLELFTVLERPRAVAGTNTLLAALYQRQGRLAQALERLSRARQMFADLGLEVDAAQSQLEEVRVRNELNLIEETEQMASAIVPVFEQRGMIHDLAEALTELGTARAKLGRFDQARATLEDARQTWLSYGNESQAALVEVSIVALELGNDDPNVLAQTLERADRAVAALERTGSRSALAFGLIVRAETLVGLGRMDEAVQTLGRADLIALELAVPDLIVQTTWRLGRVAAEKGDGVDAEHRFRRVIDQLEQVRASLAVDDFKSAYLEDKLAVYGDLVGLLIGQDRVLEALEFAERAKSRALLDQLSNNLEPQETIDPEVMRLEQRLLDVRRELNASFMRSEEERATATRSGNLVGGMEHILELEREVTELIRELERRRIGQTEFDTRPAPEDIPNAQALLERLEPDTTLIEYFEVAGELIAFVFEGQQLRVVRDLMPEAEVKARLERLEFTFARVATPGPYAAVYGPEVLRAQVDASLDDLFEGLVRPLDLQLEGQKLVVVPHGTLSAVPFAALRDGSVYLVDRARISLAPSLAVYAACRERLSSPTISMAAFGVPSKEIPAVAEEVRTVARVFPGAQMFIGESASFDAFFRHAPEASVIHIATHGAFRPDNPMFSGLKLADGWLSARDLYRLRLRGSLTVLSACESGLGAFSGGEVLGVARGFLHAGAPALVVSLWPVQDEQTAQFMTAFYTRLRGLNSVADALRGAQLELREHYPNPYHWAAFTVTGDPGRTAQFFA
jgi:tetratricopeptide (TPR) repeat protein